MAGDGDVAIPDLRVGGGRQLHGRREMANLCVEEATSRLDLSASKLYMNSDKKWPTVEDIFSDIVVDKLLYVGYQC